MLLLISALLLFADPQQRDEEATPARRELIHNLGHGGLLPLPASLHHRLDYLEMSPDRVALRGFNEDERTFFQFVFFPSLDAGNALRREIAALGLDLDTVTAVTQTRGNANPRVEILRLDGQGRFRDHLMAVAIRGNRYYAAVFLLIGPRDTFYSFTPEFTDMFENYKVDPSAVISSSGKTSLGSIGLAVALLLANLFIIWLGFREIAMSTVASE